MTAQALADEIVHGQGYVLLPDLMSAEEMAAARAILLQGKPLPVPLQSEAIAPDPRRERIYGLVYKGNVFQKMVQHPQVIELLTAILGDFVLGGFSAHVLYPGATPMGVHVDYPYFTLSPPYPAAPILEIQAIWMVDDFTTCNGAPQIAPHSQKRLTAPDPVEFAQTSQTVTGRAGSVILSHGLCWHNTSENRSSQPRISILGNYTPKFVRPIEDHQRDFETAVYDAFSPQLQRMLCLDFQTALFGRKP